MERSSGAWRGAAPWECRQLRLHAKPAYSMLRFMPDSNAFWACAGGEDVARRGCRTSTGREAGHNSPQYCSTERAWTGAVGQDSELPCVVSCSSPAIPALSADRIVVPTQHFPGRMQVVKTLLEQGADPAQADENGWAPMHVAARRGHVKVRWDVHGPAMRGCRLLQIHAIPELHLCFVYVPPFPSAGGKDAA